MGLAADNPPPLTHLTFFLCRNFSASSGAAAGDARAFRCQPHPRAERPPYHLCPQHSSTCTVAAEFRPLTQLPDVVDVPPSLPHLFGYRLPFHYTGLPRPPGAAETPGQSSNRGPRCLPRHLAGGSPERLHCSAIGLTCLPVLPATLKPFELRREFNPAMATLHAACRRGCWSTWIAAAIR